MIRKWHNVDKFQLLYFILVAFNRVFNHSLSCSIASENISFLKLESDRLIILFANLIGAYASGMVIDKGVSPLNERNLVS